MEKLSSNPHLQHTAHEIIKVNKIYERQRIYDSNDSRFPIIGNFELFSLTPMTTLNQIIESKVEAFEKEFADLTHFGCSSTKDIPCGTLRGDLRKSLRQALHDVALATVEAVRVEEKEYDPEIEGRIIAPDLPPAMDFVSRGHNAAVALQATKAEEFINGK